MRYLYVVVLLSLSACASLGEHGRSPASDSSSDEEGLPNPLRDPVRQQDLQVFYGEPNLHYTKVCQIEAEGSNSLEKKFTKKADFASQFKRRARRCPGANAVIIQNMFAFENGSAFADGSAIRIEP
jgi:hypothetical protein